MNACQKVFPSLACLFALHLAADSAAPSANESACTPASQWQAVPLVPPAVLAAEIRPGGGREAITMRVHHKTRVLCVGTGCHGFWKFSPPPSAKLDFSP